MCVYSFAVAIPLLAALVIVNQQETFRRRPTPSVVVAVTKAIAQTAPAPDKQMIRTSAGPRYR